MAQNKIITASGSLPTSVGNLLNPPTLTGGVGVPGTTTNTYFLLRVIRVINTNNTPATFSFWRGLTAGSAAGTELLGGTQQINANSTLSFPLLTRFDIANFLTGIASTSGVTWSMDFEIGIA